MVLLLLLAESNKNPALHLLAIQSGADRSQGDAVEVVHRCWAGLLQHRGTGRIFALETEASAFAVPTEASILICENAAKNQLG